MNNKFSSILLVEDEPVVRMELKSFLERYSNDVLTAKDGEEGLSFFKTFHPEIIISDIQMPKMHGIEMAKKIKAQAPEQIIIFTTAHSDSNYFLEAIEMQVDGYLLKPLDLGMLKKKLIDIHKNIETQKQKRLYASILEDITQMQDNMLAVYNHNNEAVFFNQRLLDCLGYISLEKFIDTSNLLENRFESIKGCYYSTNKSRTFWIDEMRKIESKKRIVAIKSQTDNRLKFFLLSISDTLQNKNIIINFSEVTYLMEEKLEYESHIYIDELTQIANRKRFNILFHQAIEKNKKNKNHLSLIFMDIDKFKEINDTYGHSVGDEILKKIAMLVIRNIRKTDAFSRWGGEEFVLLLENTPSKVAEGISENLRDTIEKYEFGIKKKLTCSFGVSTLRDEDSKESLFERADKALYEAKSRGRNRVVFY